MDSEIIELRQRARDLEGQRQDALRALLGREPLPGDDWVRPEKVVGSDWHRDSLPGEQPKVFVYDHLDREEVTEAAKQYGNALAVPNHLPTTIKKELYDACIGKDEANLPTYYVLILLAETGYLPLEK